ncbi:hypothetical protein GCM10009651_28360 [Microbacterium natoriense]
MTHHSTFCSREADDAANDLNWWHEISYNKCLYVISRRSLIKPDQLIYALDFYPRVRDNDCNATKSWQYQIKHRVLER